MQVSLASKPISAKKWDLKGLQGISDVTLEIHFGLYEAYVKNTNLLFERLSELRDRDEAKGSNPAFAELVRRLGWEQNGVRLHELYFDNMTAKPQDVRSGRLYDTLGEAYGGFDAWKADFAAIGGMRGVGWAIAYYDVTSKTIRNYWIEDHQNGHISGFVPIVVMDVWEHAFIRDYKPPEKGKYIEAFLTNVDWKACEARLP